MRSLYLTGFLDWGLVPDDPEAYELLMYHHDHAGQPGLHRLMELLELNVPEKDQGWTSFPVRDAVGAPVVEEIRIKTRSLIDIVRIAGACVNVPDEHIESGIANSVSSDIPRPEGLLEIKSSKRYPKNAMVATHQYGWWYYIDQTDATSKHSFNVLENLLYMRLAYAEGQTSKTPTLTIPVGR
jgi:hypothetical protein